jgi:hypothetical protein
LHRQENILVFDLGGTKLQLAIVAARAGLLQVVNANGCSPIPSFISLSLSDTYVLSLSLSFSFFLFLFLSF